VVLDTSAIAAMLFDEDDAERYEQALANDPVRLISAGTVLEAAIVIESRFGEAGGREFDLLMHKSGIDTVAVDAAQVEVARQAYRRYGKGRSNAGLNMGDCFAYALSKTSGEPLLFKGRDFSKTDVDSVALPPTPRPG
jgi:ribonuclease VapC